MRETAHRPWPLPPGRWLMSQHWADLLFAHWRVPAAVLRPLVPGRLEIETFDDSAWVAVVPFRMEAVRPRGLPAIPGLSTFPELNIRTYVRLDDRPGVFFFSLDAASRLAVAVARRWFFLPYLRARISCRRRGDGLIYQSIRTHPGEPEAPFQGRYRPAGEPFRADPGTLEHFLTERYCLYASGSSVGRPSCGLFRGEVHHGPWPLQTAEATLDVDPLLASVGLEGAGAGPPHLLFARRLEVRLWPLRPV